MRISVRGIRLAVAAAIAAGVGVGAGASARAERRVVVLDFAGTRAPMLRRDVREMIDDRFELVPAHTYVRAARRMHAQTLKAPHVARVSHAIDADAVVGGRIEERRGRLILHLRIFSGADGELLKGFAVALRDDSMSRSLRRKLSRKLDKTIGRARVRRRTEPEPDVAVPESPHRKITRRPAPRRKVTSRRISHRETARRRAPRHTITRRERRRPSRAQVRSRRQRRSPAREVRRPVRRVERRAPRRTRRVERRPPRRQVKRRAPRRTRRVERRRPRRQVKRRVNEKPVDMTEKTDGRGNVIDDEVPAVLRKH